MDTGLRVVGALLTSATDVGATESPKRWDPAVPLTCNYHVEATDAAGYQLECGSEAIVVVDLPDEPLAPMRYCKRHWGYVKDIPYVNQAAKVFRDE